MLAGALAHMGVVLQQRAANGGTLTTPVPPFHPLCTVQSDFIYLFIFYYS